MTERPRRATLTRVGLRSPTRRRRAVAILAAAVSLPIVIAAEADLHRRPAAAVRGRKGLWQVACTNAGPALVYLLIGRR